MPADEDLEQAFRAMYTRLGEADGPIPAIEKGEAHLYDVLDYGEAAWDVTGERPAADAVRETYHGLIEGYYEEDEVETQIAHHDQYFREQADEVFRDRIYNPPHALHAAFPDVLVDDIGLQTVIDRLHAYEQDHDATVTVAGMPAAEAAEGDALPVQPAEYVYGDLARELDGDYPGEHLVTPAEIQTPAADATEDDELYLMMLSRDDVDGYYPTFFFHRTVSREKRDAAAALVHDIDVVSRTHPVDN